MVIILVVCIVAKPYLNTFCIPDVSKQLDCAVCYAELGVLERL